MNQQRVINYVPVASSEAGACLTMENWQEIGIDTLSYQLTSLLMKPGIEFLMGLRDFRSYCGWQGAIVLNAVDFPSANKEGVHTIRSRYDGSLIQITSAELANLIGKLQPDQVILGPALSACFKNLGLELPESIRVDSPDYLLAKNEFPAKSELVGLSPLAAVETDKPASDAFQGQVYTEQGTIALLSNEMVNQHQVIDCNCSCPTCSQQFTRAYLHHLLIHTPLLCQRFLIQHNAHYYLRQLQSSL